MCALLEGVQRVQHEQHADWRNDGTRDLQDNDEATKVSIVLNLVGDSGYQWSQKMQHSAVRASARSLLLAFHCKPSEQHKTNSEL